MELQKKIPCQIPVRDLDEEIFVIKRDDLFSKINPWQGINTKDVSNVIDTVINKQRFYSRSAMEENPAFKQIIPYMLFTHNERYFLMQRKSKASEKRLKNKYTLGIGGHIRKEDITDNSVFGWAQREFEEEVSYVGKQTITLIGILNDDSNEVGRVHLGLIFLINGNQDTISIKSELASGSLVSLQTCQRYYSKMERWSQIIMDFLLTYSKQ